MQKTQKQMNAFQVSINSSMGMVSKGLKLALGYVSVRAITGFVKATTGLASDMTEVQNVVDVTFKSMAKDINDFAKTSIEQFGLSELSAKKYSSTMGAMLKSSGIAGEAVRNMSIDLTKLSADMASFYNLDNEAAFQKIMSGMSGMTMPLKELGINMNIANLENYALTQGIKKSWQQMNQAEQTMLRYNYLLSVTADAQGDFARNQYTWANQTKILSQQWQILKGTIGAGFINMLMPVVKGFNILIKKIQVAAEYFKAFTRLIFGDAEVSSQGGVAVETMADNLGDVEEGFGDVGKAGKKAGKDLKRALAGFDEINTLVTKANDGAGGLADGLGGVGGVGPVDLGTASSGELDIDTSKIESKLGKVKEMFEELYASWGIEDIFKGFREGLDLINFDNIQKNVQEVVQGILEIWQTLLQSFQLIAKSIGEAFGTAAKYVAAIFGNIFDAIVQGWANFINNMKAKIQEWIMNTTETIVDGFNNLRDIFELIGQAWLNSVIEFKDKIVKAVEDTLTNIAETIMLAITIVADIFKIITGKVKEFFEENKEDIQKFTDSILGMFTDVWDLINKVWTDTLDSIKKFWDTWGKDIVTGVMDFVNDIGKWFLYLLNDLVKPTWDTMMNWLKKIWDENLKGLVDELLGFVGRVGDLITKLWSGIFQPLIDNILKVLVPAIRNNFNLILDIIGTVVNGISGVIKNLLKMFNGIIDFLVGAFTGDWRRAWEGVSKVFEGIMNGLEAIFKVPLNLIISGINKFVRGLNNISIPDWVPGVGGKGFSIKEIPHLAKGGITNGPMMAVIGDNPGGREVVSPLGDLMEMIQTAVNSTNSDSPVNLNLTVKIGEDTITEKVVSNINRRSRISGKTIITV